MLARLTDSPLSLAIIGLVVLVLFGASRLPNTARQLGRSMRIFKSEMKEMKTENPSAAKRDDEDDDEVRPIDALEGRIIDRNEPTRNRTEATDGSNIVADADRNR